MVKYESNAKEVEAGLTKAAEAGMEAALLMIEASAKAGARVKSGGMRDKLGRQKKRSVS